MKSTHPEIKPIAEPLISPLVRGVETGSGNHPDVDAYATASGATDLTGINTLIEYVDGLGLLSSFGLWTAKQNQNAGSGATLYGIGGIGENGTIVNGSTWGANGLSLNGTNQYISLAIAGLASWTELSFGFRGLHDVAASPDIRQHFFSAGRSSTWSEVVGFAKAVGEVSGDLATVFRVDGAAVSYNGSNDTSINHAIGEDCIYSTNMKTGSISYNSSSVTTTLSGGAETDFTPGATGSLEDVMKIGYYLPTAPLAFDGTLIAAWACSSTLTDAQRHQIDTYVSAL